MNNAAAYQNTEILDKMKKELSGTVLESLFEEIANEYKAIAIKRKKTLKL
jgi:hypothetical protein